MENTMNINLRLDRNKLIEQRVDAPCKGLLAKAIGSYRLEELGGTPVEFVSYQEGPGLPEKPLADDDTVSREAILNFSVQMDTFLQQHHKHTKQIKGLHLLLVKPQLQILISKYVSRFFNPPVTETTGSTAMKALVLATPDLSASIGAALASVGSGLSSPEFAEQLDLNYKNCKGACVQCTALHGYGCVPKQASVRPQ
jgi:hypothetical protein